MASTGLTAREDCPKNFATKYRFFGESALKCDAPGAALVQALLPLEPLGPAAPVVNDALARNMVLLAGIRRLAGELGECFAATGLLCVVRN